MLKTEQYVSRPCKTFNAPALWDWLESMHPVLMARFAEAFVCEINEHFWGVPSQHPELREHVKRFLK